MNRKILLLTVLMAAAPGLATSASVYKWTDENGVTHFGDRQPTGRNAEQVNVRSGTSQGAGVQRRSAQEQLGTAGATGGRATETRRTSGCGSSPESPLSHLRYGTLQS